MCLELGRPNLPPKFLLSNPPRPQGWCHVKGCTAGKTWQTILFSGLNISGAIQPSVPMFPVWHVTLLLPCASFLQSPKSEIMAFTSPWALGREISTLWGLMSRWTRWYKTTGNVDVWQWTKYHQGTVLCYCIILHCSTSGRSDPNKGVTKGSVLIKPITLWEAQKMA